MTLARALLPDGKPVRLPGAAPYPCRALRGLDGVPFRLPCDDPWVRGGGDASHAYLDGARQAWDETPDWMDLLDPTSPCFHLKQLERELYEHHWRPWLGAERVLDVGCGVGRMSMPFLDAGASVWGVDADIRALQRFAWRAAGRAGRLDLSWSSVHALPEVEVDLAIACEVLCYVPEVETALRAIVERLRPGGVLLIAMEARWGWALAADAPEDALEQALGGDGVVHLEGDRWVRTCTEAELRALLEGAGLEVASLVATHYLHDGPLEQVTPQDLALDAVLAVEERCRRHPVWGPLNRIWTAAARKV